MKKLDTTKISGRRYKLPEGYYAIETRFGDQVYNENGENVTQKIMGAPVKTDRYIILTDKGIAELEPAE